jgi:hypothetical protein
MPALFAVLDNAHAAASRALILFSGQTNNEKNYEKEKSY